MQLLLTRNSYNSYWLLLPFSFIYTYVISRMFHRHHFFFVIPRLKLSQVWVTIIQIKIVYLVVYFIYHYLRMGLLTLYDCVLKRVNELFYQTPDSTVHSHII